MVVVKFSMEISKLTAEVGGYLELWLVLSKFMLYDNRKNSSLNKTVILSKMFSRYLEFCVNTEE